MDSLRAPVTVVPAFSRKQLAAINADHLTPAIVLSNKNDANHSKYFQMGNSVEEATDQQTADAIERIVPGVFMRSVNFDRGMLKENTGEGRVGTLALIKAMLPMIGVKYTTEVFTNKIVKKYVKKGRLPARTAEFSKPTEFIGIFLNMLLTYRLVLAEELEHGMKLTGLQLARGDQAFKVHKDAFLHLDSLDYKRLDSNEEQVRKRAEERKVDDDSFTVSPGYFISVASLSLPISAKVSVKLMAEMDLTIARLPKLHRDWEISLEKKIHGSSVLERLENLTLNDYNSAFAENEVEERNVTLATTQTLSIIKDCFPHTNIFFKWAGHEQMEFDRKHGPRD